MRKPLCSVIVVVALILATLPVSVTAQDDDRVAKLALMERFTQELWIGWQYDIADEILADDFVKISWGIPDMDRETYFETTLKPLATIFPDYSMPHPFVLVDGDDVVVGDNWGGTFENEWAGLPPTGEEVRVNGVEVYRIEEDRIAEAWILYDTLSFMQQMGAVPVEGEITPDEPWDIALGETSSTPEEHKALLIEVFQDVSDHDLDAAYAPYTEDAVVHDQDGDMTWEEAKAMMAGIQTAFPDHHATDASYFAEGDLAVTVFTLVFVEDEVMFGGLNVYRFEDGKIAEEWWLYDALTFMQLTAPPAQD